MKNRRPRKYKLRLLGRLDKKGSTKENQRSFREKQSWPTNPYKFFKKHPEAFPGIYDKD